MSSVSASLGEDVVPVLTGTEKLVKALQDQDRGVLVDKLASHLQSLKRSGATSKQIEAMERLVRESQSSTSPPSSKMHTPISTAPTSPGLRVDIKSAAPTPSLTMGLNSPLSTPSSNPPYLNGDTVEVVNGKEPAPPSKP
jgi:mRNA-binding protein PUF3